MTGPASTNLGGPHIMDLILEGSQPAPGAIWSRSLLQPLAPGALTPFSASMIAASAPRAWHQYYDRLGFEPPARPRLVRMFAGRPFVDETLSAGIEVQHTGQEPPRLRVNGQPLALSAWEKPGFLGGLKLGRGAKRVSETLDALAHELDAVTERARAWQRRVVGLRWSQAEVLQIMEEIERVAAATLLPYVAVRRHLEQSLWRLLDVLSAADGPRLVAQALAGGEAPLEAQMAQGIVQLAGVARGEPSAARWLRDGAWADWEAALPDGPFQEGLRRWLADFGHRAVGEGDLAAPRWYEDPAPVFGALAALLEKDLAPSRPPADGLPALIAAVGPKSRKLAEQWVFQLRRWLPVQSRALHAYAYILAGTRRWALAAGREAMGDGRLPAIEDVFFYELEEMKEMMTGEWNVSDLAGIHGVAAERKGQVATWRAEVAPPFLVGDGPVRLTQQGLPGAPGQAQGPVQVAPDVQLATTTDVIVTGVQPDSGWTVYLPAAAGLVAAQGSALDPAVAAARALGVPAVVEVGDGFVGLETGQQVTVDGDRGCVG